MIVADTNIIAHLFLPSDHTSFAEELLQIDSSWAAPMLWRSELRNVLMLYLRRGLLSFEQAYATQSEAEQLMGVNEFEVDSLDVLSIANSGTISAYDAEFVALARHLDVPLVTLDKKVLNELPETASSPEIFMRRPT